MTNHQLVDTPNARGSRRRAARRAPYAFAPEETPTSPNEDEITVWIVDARGILILPVDQHRLGLAFVVEASTESPDGIEGAAAISTSPNER